MESEQAHLGKIDLTTLLQYSGYSHNFLSGPNKFFEIVFWTSYKSKKTYIIYSESTWPKLSNNGLNVGVAEEMMEKLGV